MSDERPTVSVLITTYNRSRLLRRAIDSVLTQDFTDFELVVLDDCSTDDTPETVASYSDVRLRYIRNPSNVGSRFGDRALVRRFVYELMRGQYFVYLCDDDYWLFPTLLSRQIEAFRAYDNVAMVIAGQLSYYVAATATDTETGEQGEVIFTPENIGKFFDMTARRSKVSNVEYLANLFSSRFLTGEQYLREFASDPVAKNRIVGATLYSRSHFMRAGAMLGNGSKWQAGYEFLMGPACFGNVVYFDEPAVVTDIRSTNASFQRTQVDHYLDSVMSIEAAFEAPLKSWRREDQSRQANAVSPHALKAARNLALCNLSRSYIGNTITILNLGSLTLCGPENIARPVTWAHILPVLFRNGALSQLRRVDLVSFKKVICGYMTRSASRLRRLMRRGHFAEIFKGSR